MKQSKEAYSRYFKESSLLNRLNAMHTELSKWHFRRLEGTEGILEELRKVLIKFGYKD